MPAEYKQFMQGKRRQLLSDSLVLMLIATLSTIVLSYMRSSGELLDIIVETVSAMLFTGVLVGGITFIAT